MTPEKLEFFRTLLHERLEKLQSEADKALTDLTQEKENIPDSIDLASEESERDFNIRIKDRERRLILKVREALERINEGTFGVCVACGEDISERRLIARPVTTHCIDCKTAAEQMEKRRGLS
ncbi:MAG: RNA polymerase-binding protein DksA [Myxococcota bacterium]